MRVDLHPAFILHTRPFSDSSLLLEIFTLEYGRISALAKGVRGKPTRFKAGLQAFSPLLISWAGKNELKTITAVENNGPSLNLFGEALFVGFYLNELLMHLLHRFDPHPELFYHYHSALSDLQNPSAILQQKALRIFEKQLLQQLGYGISFDLESVTGTKIQQEHWYWFESEKGFIKCNGINSIRHKYSGRQLLAIAENDFSDPAVLMTAKKLMRLAFSRLLGNIELKSRELFSYKI